MAAERDGNEVNLISQGRLTPLYCGDPAYHGPHPHTLDEECVINGAVFPKGLKAWCEGTDHYAGVEEQTTVLPHLTAVDMSEPHIAMREIGERARRFDRLRIVRPQSDVPAMNDMNYDLHRQPLFGINDEKGRSLLEFRLRADGTLDAKYYEDDLSEACLQFVKQLMRMAGRGHA